ncbi:MAG: altronate oxidoreductase [Bacteroidetes bacterium]|nr:MAG: altronate oxidoreductase [Bacteroidota bacterium]
MILSRNSLKQISSDSIEIPGEEIFLYPEKILQFGTGVLLRGLPDYFIDKANKKGLFKGRIVVVKSTETGRSDEFGRQDALYTHLVQGISEGKSIREFYINASISRVLSAVKDWKSILNCALNRELEIIISNTTEVGIELRDDDIRANPPDSFPGKLVSFLYHRYKKLGENSAPGFVIVPTELIPDNGLKLKTICFELAKKNGLENEFIEWLTRANTFCNSLVDRIVPGKPNSELKNQIENEIGYKDDLMIISESYRLWAIEADERAKNVLSFYRADEGVKIEPDITIYRELKLRLLNGVHTLSSGLAFLAGIKTVKEAMNILWLSNYIQSLMLDELAPAIPYAISKEESRKFGMQVLDRFRNPGIEHEWINITLQYSSKMRMRNIPLLLNYYKIFGKVPQLLAKGFAAYLLFSRPVKKQEGNYRGEWNGILYPVRDDKVDIFFKVWNSNNPNKVVDLILANENLWGSDLSTLSGFADAVKSDLQFLMNSRVEEWRDEFNNCIEKKS